MKKIHYFFLYIFEKLNLELNIIYPLIPDNYTIMSSQSDLLCLEVQKQASKSYERKLSIVDKKGIIGARLLYDVNIILTRISFGLIKVIYIVTINWLRIRCIWNKGVSETNLTIFYHSHSYTIILCQINSTYCYYKFVIGVRLYLDPSLYIQHVFCGIKFRMVYGFGDMWNKFEYILSPIKLFSITIKLLQNLKLSFTYQYCKDLLLS